MADQVEALPLKSFEYGGTVRAPRKGAFLIDRRTAQQLEAMGMLKIVAQTPDPSPAAGEQRSASPAAQASPQPMSSESDGGAKRGRPKRQDVSS